MKVLIALLFLAAVVFVRAEEEKEPDMKFHPQAVLHYLEMEDEKMAKHVRSILKMDQKKEPRKESMFPTALPTGIPKRFARCAKKAVICHKIAGNNSCEHLECIKETGCCLKVAGLQYQHLPEPLKKCLPVIPCCMLTAKSCEEKLCCFVRFGECARRFAYKPQ